MDDNYESSTRASREYLVTRALSRSGLPATVGEWAGDCQVELYIESEYTLGEIMDFADNIGTSRIVLHPSTRDGSPFTIMTVEWEGR